jgi:putative oxidoreductase
MPLLDLYDDLTARLRSSGDYIWPLLLRTVMFWEFWESGLEKLHGVNWFATVPWAEWQVGFPFPFSLMPHDLNWFTATWGELVLSIMVLLGVFTRFAAFSLLVITVVAMVAVHWPNSWDSLATLWQGYGISSSKFGNFKLPLLFMIMLIPLVFYGGGKISVDQLLLKFTARGDELTERLGDITAAGLGFLILGVATVYAIAPVGWTFLVLGVLCVAAPRFLR